MTATATTTETSSDTITGFSQVEIEELKQSFQLFDVEGTGKVSVGDLTNVLQTLQQEGAPYPHLEKLLYILSERDRTDEMEFKDYLQLMAMTTLNYTLQSDTDETSKLAHVFDLFDSDRKGYITIDDLERTAVDLGEHEMTREELTEMIERAQTKQKSSKGRVTLEDFINMMTLNLFPRETGDVQTT
jgi:Ca2+-binding EF-hand superfamily protein